MRYSLWCTECTQTVMLSSLLAFLPLSGSLSLCCRGYSPLCLTLCLTLRHQAALFFASNSHMFVSLCHILMTLLQTSLNHRRGLPTDREPFTKSPYKRSFGMRPFSILLTCQSQRFKDVCRRVMRICHIDTNTWEVDAKNRAAWRLNVKQ